MAVSYHVTVGGYRSITLSVIDGIGRQNNLYFRQSGEYANSYYRTRVRFIVWEGI